MRILLAGLALVVGLGACGSERATSPSSPAPSGDLQVTSVVAHNLEVPWGIGFLPDGTAIVTERDSRQVLTIRDGQTKVIGTIPAASPRGEAGLLGVAVSPTFDKDQQLFFYYTSATDNRVVRTTFRNGELGPLDVILDGIPAASIHDGGRMIFGPDGSLYVATGDASERSLAQDSSSLGGKILRITTDGSPAPDNPNPASPVWSLGHRNVQGLAFDSTGQLWASEFGANDVDELNRIERGGNYGWPEIEGKGNRAEFIDPVLTWPVAAASPSGLTYLNGSLWMASLRGERLWQIPLNGSEVEAPIDHLVQGYGRLRTAVAAPNGQLWVTTSNRDGRGNPVAEDDRILAVTVP